LQALGRVLDHVPDAEAFRFGGDEFCLLFAGCTRKQVEERCRTAQEKFLGNDLCRKYAEVNVSFGLAQYDRKIQRADHALYEAKKNRGSICFYQPEETE
jgi:diguanylate cyclase